MSYSRISIGHQGQLLSKSKLSVPLEESLHTCVFLKSGTSSGLSRCLILDDPCRTVMNHISSGQDNTL